MDDKYHRMDGKAIRRPQETGSRSGAMEDHDSQPSQGRRHLMMMSSGVSRGGLRGVSKSRKFKWLVKVSASKHVTPFI